MMQFNQITVPSRFATEFPTATVNAMTDVLRSECKLLQELLAVMQRQREAVAADDLQAAEESVYATHRELHTLSEARRRRRAINRKLGESDDLPIRGLDEVLGGRMPDELRQTRDELELLARALTSEVDINRRVLRHALTTGDEYVKSLCGSIEQRRYTVGLKAGGAERTGGHIVNRIA